MKSVSFLFLLFSLSFNVVAQEQSSHENVSAEAAPTHSAEHEGGEHHGLPHQHLAVLLGAGYETEDGHSETGFVAGFEYQYQFHERWGAAAELEWLLGSSTSRAWLFAALAMYHPNERWQVFAGPGFDSHDGHKKAVARLGVTYAIPLKKKRVFNPTFIVDYGEGGRLTFLIVAAIGIGF